MPHYGRRTYTGTFWGVLNVSLCAWGTQLGFDLTCNVIRHGKNLIMTKHDRQIDRQTDTQTDRRHISIIYGSSRCSLFRPSERSGIWTLVVEDCQPGDSGSYRCQVRESCVSLSVFSSRLLVSEISNPILCL